MHVNETVLPGMLIVPIISQLYIILKVIVH